MKIICPQCNTAYKIPADKVGETGRKVKCASCNHIWQVASKVEDEWAIELNGNTEVHNNSTPINERAEPFFSQGFDESALAGANKRASRHVAFSDDDLGIGSKEVSSDSISSKDKPTGPQSSGPGDEPNETPQDSTSADEEPSKEKNQSEGTPQKPRARTGKKTKSARKSGAISAKGLLGASLLTMSLALCFTAVQYRESLVRAFPDLAGLYQLAGMTVNLRGLVFKDLRTFREVDDGSLILVVEGAVENITGSETYIPAIKLALRSQDTQEIHSWIVEPQQERLAPGDRTRFRTRLDNPPERAADIQLRFIERQKKRASIR
ncbi:hypothetical protein PsAD2_01623 [Pseudovibrio axinellae]|uniref:Zinc finger/thioredoxin putative domain-containing protein n=1 Tax=Pseudovibrio axinellae TaxID=989403 RepID=A0A165ZQ16_9HYPH|nr:zinc-ribbon domain-containing protein [Pseudovibrio axinellae]KZL20136.1 hypothetical protein PsAD2_01623 [Pseudovibrio axinellae]SEQ23808.1 MJ0042 family finger-like domain-containing protein [Pseudovibrio axinellae]